MRLYLISKASEGFLLFLPLRLSMIPFENKSHICFFPPNRGVCPCFGAIKMWECGHLCMNVCVCVIEEGCVVCTTTRGQSKASPLLSTSVCVEAALLLDSVHHSR